MTSPPMQQDRKWSWGYKILAILLFLVLFVIGIYYLSSRASETAWQRYVAEFKAAGSPLTFEEIEAKRRVIPKERNSALVLQSLANRLDGIGLGPRDDDVLIFRNRNRHAAMFEGIPRESIDVSRRYVDSHRNLLDELALMRELANGRIDLPREFVVGSSLSEAFHVLASGKLTRVDGMIHLVDGDLEGAVHSARLQFAIGGSLDEYPSVFARMAQMAVQDSGVRTIEDVLRVGELKSALLDSLDATVSDAIDDSSLQWALWGERASFVEVMNQMIAGKISLGDLLASGSGSSPVLPDIIVRRNQACGVEILTWMVKDVHDPVALLEASRRADDAIDGLPMTQLLVRLLIQGSTRAITPNARCVAELRCARAALAAEQFRLKSGHLPTSLSELVPNYLDEIPLDPFNGDPMRMVSTDEGIVIYSVYEDLVDDGGKVSRRDKSPYYLDVGFRLLKPEHRGLIIIDETDPGED